MLEYFAYAKFVNGGVVARSNPLKKWRTVAQVAQQCRVTSQAVRDAVKAGKIEAWSVGEYLLIHKDQIPLFEKTRQRKFHQVANGQYRVEYLPARGRRKVAKETSQGQASDSTSKAAETAENKA